MIRRASLVLLLAACNTPSSLRNTLTEITNTDALVSGAGRLRVTRADAATSAVVKLTSSSVDVATVPASITLQEGETSAEVAWQGVSVGTTVFTATIGKSSVTSSARVVSARRPDDFFFDWDRIQVGASTTVWLYMSATLGTDDVMTCTSSDPDVIAVPASTPIPAWSSGGLLAVTANSPGVAKVTCEVGGVSVSDTVTVVADLQLNADLDYLRGEVGGDVSFYVGVNAIPADTAVVTLTSSAPNLVSVPSEAVIEDATAVSVAASILGVGTSLITMTYGDQTRVISVTGVDKMHLRSARFSESLVTAGTPTEIIVSMDGFVAKPVNIGLTSSDASVLTVPASLQIGRNNSNARLIVLPKKAGSVTVTATINGEAASDVLRAVEKSSLTRVDVEDTPFVGANSRLTVRIDAPNYADQIVTLTSSNPAAISVPATVSVPAGDNSGTVPISFPGVGVATITASLNGTTVAQTQTVRVQQPSLDVQVSPQQALAGDDVNVEVSVGYGVPTATVVTLTSSNPNVLSLPASVTFPANTYSITLSAKAAAVGNTLITAQSGSTKAIARFDALTARQLGNVSSAVLQWGAVTELSSSVRPAVSAATPVTVTIDDPTLAEVVTSPTLSPGDAYFNFLIRAKNVSGTTNLTLTLGQSVTTSQIVTKQTPTINLSGTSPHVGKYSSIDVSADCVLTDGVVLSFSSTNPSVVTVFPTTLLVSASNNSPSVQLYGVTGGTGDIVVTGPTGITGLAPIAITVTP